MGVEPRSSLFIELNIDSGRHQHVRRTAGVMRWFWHTRRRVCHSSWMGVEPRSCLSIKLNIDSGRHQKHAIELIG